MPSALVEALVAQLVELQMLVGSGDLRAPGDASAVLRRAGHSLEELASAGAGADARIGDDWSGAAAEAAARSASARVAATRGASSRSMTIAARVDAATEAVARAIALSREKYCSVSNSLRQDIEFVTTFEVQP